MTENIAQLKCGDTVFNIALADNYNRAHCYMNDIHVISSKELSSFFPIVGMLVTSACETSPEICLKRKPSYSDFLRDLIDVVNRSDSVKIKVLEDKPDELDNQKPKQASLNGTKLEDYRNNLKSFYDCASDVVKLSDVLLKTKLPKNIRALEELNRVISKAKVATNEFIKEEEDYDKIVEQTENRIGQVIIAMRSSNKNDYNIRKIIKTGISNITDNFMKIKNLLAFVINSYYRLYDVDRIFKKYTGYPVTWFFGPSVFYNFSERYKDVLDNLIEAVRIEGSVVRPLNSWISELNGRN